MWFKRNGHRAKSHPNQSEVFDERKKKVTKATDKTFSIGYGWNQGVKIESELNRGVYWLVCVNK